MRKIFLTYLLLFFFISGAFGARIKDIANIEGVSGVQIIGYGLVTGLNNTGDDQSSSAAVQSVINMLKRFGVTISNTNPRMQNVAAVMVTTTVPNFSKKSSKFDVTVSSIGNAKSLQGGVLLMTPMSVNDGTVIAMAQGALSVGGYDYQSQGSRAGKNFTTTARVPSGGILEQDISGQYVNNNKIRIILRQPDFTTAVRIAQAVNTVPSVSNGAEAIDPGTVEVALAAGQSASQVSQLISNIESLTVVADMPGKVVINERTGTIVVGGNVQLLPAVVAHGGIEIKIQKNVVVSQPAPFTVAPSRTIESAQITADEQQNNAPAPVVLPATANVQDMANALQLLKVTPRDLIAIFQALKESGSLQGELIIQ